MTMISFVKISLLLCAFGFFRELRPNEPFAAEFLSGEWRNVTIEQVNREIYPLGTYSHMAQLIVIFLITDFLRYKPIIVLSAVVGIVMWILLLWTTTLTWLKVVQFFYGTYMSCEVAYYTYMYAKVEKDKYQKVTSHTRAAISAGKFLSGITGQILVSFDVMDLRQLNYVSLGTQIISLFFAFALPQVKESLYFHSKSIQDASTELNPATQTRLNPLLLLKTHFIQAYTNREVLYWSIWWSLATAGFIQATSYAQILWQEIDPNKDNFYNGAVEAIHTLFATIIALIAGLINMKFFERHHLWVITGCSLLQGGLVLWEGLTGHILLAYAMHIMFGTIYMLMITLVSASVAKQLVDDSFALIFGINTFLALVFQSIFTFIVVGEIGFALSPKYQYVVNGCYFLVLAVMYLIFATTEKLFRKIRRN